MIKRFCESNPNINLCHFVVVRFLSVNMLRNRENSVLVVAVLLISSFLFIQWSGPIDNSRGSSVKLPSSSNQNGDSRTSLSLTDERLNALSKQVEELKDRLHRTEISSRNDVDKAESSSKSLSTETQNAQDAKPFVSATATPSSNSGAGPSDNDGFVKIVDGHSGLSVRLPWIPRRSLAKLAIDVKSNDYATLIVDNWFGNVHDSSLPAKWSLRPEEIELVGRASELPLVRAPRLPTCALLSASGSLSSPLIATNDKFPPFNDMSTLVRTGSDSNGWINSTGSKIVNDVADPHSVVRSLIWHRITFAETSDFIGLDTEDGRNKVYASMTDFSRQRYCSVNGAGLSGDFRPRLACDGKTENPISTQRPYCNRPTAPAAIVSIDCAIVENGAYNEVIIFNVITFDAGGNIVTFNAHMGGVRWAIPSTARVIEYDELGCVGTSVYPTAPGHFFNEILPRLIHMDMVLPTRIPMLWPPGEMPKRMLASFIASGLVSKDRVFVDTVNGASTLYRAKRLYVFTSDYDPGLTPLILTMSQRMFAARLHSWIESEERKRSSLSNAPALDLPFDHGGIVLILRNKGEPRSIVNEDELISSLRSQHPGIFIDAFVPGSPGRSFLECSSRVYGAKVVIGPHGANMNNFVGAKPGTWVVEIGYSDEGSPLPGDYFCQARNLGMRYWLSMADSGSYSSGIIANVPDILRITKMAYNQSIS